MSLANFLKVTGITMRTPVIASTTLITVMLTTVKALIDVAKRQERRFCTAVGAVTKLLIA
jgi:hypothetical protein